MSLMEFKHIHTLKILVIFAAQLFFIDLAKGEEIQKDTLRASKVLNGEWLFQPACGKAEQLPDSQAWGKIWVPGAWVTQNAWWTKVPGISKKGYGPSWNSELAKVYKGWYEHSVNVPDKWKGKTVELSLERVATDAVIFINGNKAGEIEWYSGKVDITPWILWGKKNKIQILVIASPDQDKVAILMGTAESQVSFSEASLPTRGITGNVILECRPAGLHIADCFIKTSFRNKTIEAEIEFANSGAKELVTIVSKIFDHKGNLVKQFTNNCIPDEKTSVAKTFTRWEHPVLWDLDSPFLYQYQSLVYISGHLVDSYCQTFGFREFWIEGRNFYLNGARINLRPTLDPPGNGMTELISAGISGLKKTGYNFAELWPNNYDVRGEIRDWHEVMQVADKEGFLVSGVILPFTSYILDNTWSFRWDQPGVKEKWEKRMLQALKKQRNHPSVIMWGTSPNFFGHPQDQNPLLIGQKGWIKDNSFWSKNADAAKDAISIIKKHDSTRPVFTHHGSYVGDVHTVNLYLNLIPLQEREEWLSHYSQFGAMPFMGIEFGTPLHCTFLRGRNGFGPNISTEPLVTEFVAMYNGSKAYFQETNEYRELIRKNFKEGQTYIPWPHPFQMERMPGFQELQQLFIRNTWRSWRTWGIAGGMVPWSKGHGWLTKDDKDSLIAMPAFVEGREGNYFPTAAGTEINYLQAESWNVLPGGQTLIDNNNDVLAYIGGSKNAFTAKDHHYKPGECVEKQLFIFNDTRKTQHCHWEFDFFIGNSSVSKDSGKLQLSPGEKTSLPIYHRLPTSQDSFKREGKIVVKVLINNKELRDTLIFRIFNRPLPKHKTIFVFDPEGSTRNMLQHLGYTVEQWDGSLQIPFLIMGRNSMLASYKPSFDLEKFVFNGGKVLVMNQHPDSFAIPRGFRYSAFVTRYAFPVSKGSLFDGLDETDFRNWTGNSKMVEAYPDYLNNNNYRKANGSPYYGWKWGNRGGVATGAIEKPHRSSWRPLMECEFDLAYSPLMELPYGSGHLIFNNLDIEDHYHEDVIATLFFDRLIRYIDMLRPIQKSRNVSLLGTNKDEQFLNNIGLVFKKVKNLNGKTDLLFVGNIRPEQGKQVLKYVQKGGKVLVLPRSTGEQFLGVKFRLDTFCYGANSLPDWRESLGLSHSDTRYRTPHPTWLLDNGCDIGANGFLGSKVFGKGKLVFCQFDPDRFSADSLTYFRFTRWRQTRAFAQVATNMGAACTMDKAFFNPVSVVKAVPLEGEWKVAMTRPLPSVKNVSDKYSDPGISSEALALIPPDADESKMVGIPSNLEFEQAREEWNNLDGELIYRKKVFIPPQMARKDLLLNLGVIDDYDNVYWNGILIGKTGKEKEPVWNYNRIYDIPSEIVKEGFNVLVIRVFDTYGGGGLVPTLKRREITLKENIKQESFYHSDYLDDFELGDDPFRYFRW